MCCFYVYPIVTIVSSISLKNLPFKQFYQVFISYVGFFSTIGCEKVKTAGKTSNCSALEIASWPTSPIIPSAICNND